MINITCVPLGSYMTNCYILKDEASGEVAVIDPGVYDEVLCKTLEELGVEKVRYILLTHGHFDHLCGVYGLHESFGGEVMIHREDRLALEDPDESFAVSASDYRQTSLTEYKTFDEGDKIMLGETEISVMHTPGHTRGGVCFIAGDCLFSGDTLFKVGVGRTDLPGGHLRTLCRSLLRIGALEGDYRIYPGHGEKTTLSYEKTMNILLVGR